MSFLEWLLYTEETLHGKLIKAAKTIYASNGKQFNESGLCHGISVRWVEAVILNMEDTFNQRIAYIIKNNEEIVTLLKQINSGQKSFKDYPHLIDIVAFFDSVNIFQTPSDWPELFLPQKKLSQSNTIALSEVASANMIQAQGGLVPIYSQALIMNVTKLGAYLDSLGYLFENLSPACKQPLAILLSNGHHIIALTYTKKYGWKFMDINQYPPRFAQIGQGKLLADQIALGFQGQQFGALGITILTTGSNKLRAPLKEKLDQWKKQNSQMQLDPKHPQLAALFALAVKRGDLDTIRAIKQLNIDLNFLKFREHSCMFFALEAPNPEEVITELYNSGMDINVKIPPIQGSFIQYFLPNYSPEQNYTPAFYAALTSNLPAIKILYELGADFTVSVSLSKKTLLDLANAWGLVDKMNAFLTSSSSSLISVSITAYDLVMMKYPEEIQKIHLFKAMQSGLIKELKLVAVQNEILNSLNSQGFLPINIAAQYGNIGIIKALATYGADLNCQNAHGDTTAHIAAQKGDLGIIEVLKIHKVNFEQQNAKGDTPVLLAAKNRHPDVIEILAKHGVDLNYANAQGDTSIIIATKNRHPEMIEVLAVNGADLNHANAQGETSSFIAAQNGYTDVIEILAKHGADLNYANAQGDTITLIAAKNRHPDIIEVLAKHGADLNHENAQGETSAYIAARSGYTDVIDVLIKNHANLNVKNCNGDTPALVAARNGNLDILRRLETYGVDLSQTNANGISPFLIAILTNNNSIVKKLNGSKKPIIISLEMLDHLKMISKNNFFGEKLEQLQALIKKRMPINNSKSITVTAYDLSLMGHSYYSSTLPEHHNRNSSYHLLVSHYDKPINNARAVLSDYTKNNYDLLRFFTGHWNRHHVAEVNEIINKIDAELICTENELLDELNKIILVNKNGSLSKRIEFIGQLYENSRLGFFKS